MAVYSLAVRWVGGSAATALAEIYNTSNERTKLLEFGLFPSGGGSISGALGIGRPAAKGLSPVALFTATVQQEGDGERLGLVQVATAWVTGPTIPANFLRRWEFPVGGAGRIWRFPRGITIPALSSLVVWTFGTLNAGGGDLSDMYFVVED